MSEAVIVGEAVAGESHKIRKQLESLIKGLNKSNFDIGELLNTIRNKGFYTAWGFTTFQDYVKTLGIKARKAQYLVRIVDVMNQVGVSREKYEPLGIAKLRKITSLDPNATWTNPETKEEIPMKDFIIGFIDKGHDMTPNEIEKHIRTLKGFVGSADLTWLNICVTREVMDNTIRPALELAKANIGTVGKDEEGMAKDASDGAALEVIAIEFLNNPSNNVLTESGGD